MSESQIRHQSSNPEEMFSSWDTTTEKTFSVQIAYLTLDGQKKGILECLYWSRQTHVAVLVLQASEVNFSSFFWAGQTPSALAQGIEMNQIFGGSIGKVGTKEYIYRERADERENERTNVQTVLASSRQKLSQVFKIKQSQIFCRWSTNLWNNMKDYFGRYLILCGFFPPPCTMLHSLSSGISYKWERTPSLADSMPTM